MRLNILYITTLVFAVLGHDHDKDDKSANKPVYHGAKNMTAPPALAAKNTTNLTTPPVLAAKNTTSLNTVLYSK